MLQKFLKEKTGLGPLEHTEFGKGGQSVSQISQTRNGTFEKMLRDLLGGLGDGWTGKGLGGRGVPPEGPL